MNPNHHNSEKDAGQNPFTDPNGPSGQGGASGSGSTGTRIHRTPIKIAPTDLKPISWLIKDLLLYGEVTTLAGQGGASKTAFAIWIATGLAAGLQNIGPFVVKGQQPGGLHVLFISAEEDANRIGLLVAAAASVLKLKPSQLQQLEKNFTFFDAVDAGWQIGEPKDKRDVIAPEAEDRGLNELAATLTGTDLVVLDTAASLLALPSELDNQAITKLIRRINKVLRRTGCAGLMLHHTPKMTREEATKHRGEATLVRGGGSFVNSCRIAVSLTSLPNDEAAGFIMQGVNADLVRRIEHVKINDAPPMVPAFLKITGVDVKVSDGSEQSVRAIEHIIPAAGGGNQASAIWKLVLSTIHGGIQDKHGATVPLSPAITGKDTDRNPIEAIAKALKSAYPNRSEKEIKVVATKTFRDLFEAKYVEEYEVMIPKYKVDGQQNGSNKRKGLHVCWGRVPKDLGGTPMRETVATAMRGRPDGG